MEEPVDETSAGAMLAFAIARHVSGATADREVVELNVGDIQIACRLNATRDLGDQVLASLFFELFGGPLGDTPIFASAVGYGATAKEALVSGACWWARACVPVLAASVSEEPADGVERVELTLDGRDYSLFISGFDRTAAGQEIPGERARAHLGAEPWLTERVIASGTLPLITNDRSTVLSVFCAEQPPRRTFEVKVNGTDWAPSAHLYDDVPLADARDRALLRELAVLVPRSPSPPLTRSSVERTLRGAARTEVWRGMTRWRGWSAHAGLLGEQASGSEVTRLRSEIGELPDDYEAFLTDVAASGAGPGYGLISPFHPEQRRLAEGRFEWENGCEPARPPRGVLALAHAGCGVMWLLVLEGTRRGEVWVDAMGSDNLARRVAPSFDAWYRAWLDALVRDLEMFTQWDGRGCAPAATLSQRIDEGEGWEPRPSREGSIATVNVGDVYFDHLDPVDPCQSCTTLAASAGRRESEFIAGRPPRVARPPRRSLWQRLFGR
ncbi:MAG: SMI1/KNR4 family protein [Sandaracinaceae bacterium]